MQRRQDEYGTAKRDSFESRIKEVRWDKLRKFLTQNLNEK